MLQKAFARVQNRRRRFGSSKRATRPPVGAPSLLPEPLQRRVLMTMSVDVTVSNGLTSIMEGGDVQFTFSLTGAEAGVARNVEVSYTFTTGDGYATPIATD